MDMWDKTAIAGIGATEFSTDSHRSELSLAVEACRAAIEDAGVDPKDVDGITRFSGDSNSEYTVAQTLGIENLRYQASTSIGGSLGPGGTVLLAALRGGDRRL